MFQVFGVSKRGTIARNQEILSPVGWRAWVLMVAKPQRQGFFEYEGQKMYAYERRPAVRQCMLQGGVPYS